MNAIVIHIEICSPSVRFTLEVSPISHMFCEHWLKNVRENSFKFEWKSDIGRAYNDITMFATSVENTKYYTF